jgi:hypothetical protein
LVNYLVSAATHANLVLYRNAKTARQIIRGKLIADAGKIPIHRFKVLKVPFVRQMGS